ncbi:MAG: hypothetical protein KGH93_02485 [Patescibacteria group bacterium]|nr:hypothetical protein [Patescibacteria group bacterium]MDE1946042.1 hypothetical protein [Patescibacteria group bacterium]
MNFLILKAYAQGITAPSGVNTNTTFDKLYNNVLDQIVTPIIYLLFALALIYFFWGVFQFIKNADNETERENGKWHMIWGVIGMFIMISAKGLINIILATLGLK